MNKIFRALFVTLFSFAALPIQAAETPNFVIIYADDLGYTPDQRSDDEGPARTNAQAASDTQS